MRERDRENIITNMCEKNWTQEYVWVKEREREYDCVWEREKKYESVCERER